MARRSVSNPISNSRRTTPSCASRWMTSASTPVLGTMPSAEPPRSAPATSSPSTAGCPMRSASSPSTFAAMRIAASARSSLATSTLERLLDARTELEGLLKEGEVDGLAVLRLDRDGVVAPVPGNTKRRRGAQERVGLGRETGANDVVGVLVGEHGLLLHVVLELIEPPVDAADVDSVVHRGAERGRTHQAAERAGASLACANAHHCDWAPSTMLVTRSSSARCRPCCS